MELLGGWRAVGGGERRGSLAPQVAYAYQPLINTTRICYDYYSGESRRISSKVYFCWQSPKSHPMKYFIIFIIGLVLIWFFLIKPRKDILYSASDELHMIVLYENNDDFLAMFHGLDLWEGKYNFRNDTIFLTYFDDEIINNKQANDVLIRKLKIDFETGRVKSADAESKGNFCAYGGRGNTLRQALVVHSKNLGKQRQ